MRQRCLDEQAPGYKDYGGRGVTICDRWSLFALFLEDMGERPEGTTLDRFPDVNGNYEPGNCRWASAKAQARNRRSSKLNVVMVSLIRQFHRRGETYDGIANAFGVSRGTVNDIVSRRTWT